MSREADTNGEPPKALTLDELATLPLADRARFWLEGSLPDGRRVIADWQRPHDDIHAYVAALSVRLRELTEARREALENLYDAEHFAESVATNPSKGLYLRNSLGRVRAALAGGGEPAAEDAHGD